jgi:Ca2+-binding RTX toxin-like protein
VSDRDGGPESGIRIRRLARRVSLPIAASLGLIAAVAAVVSPGPARAAAACASSVVPNAATTTSADGTTVYGSPCPDLIVVTSPEVVEVRAGEGDDVIYANPDVEVVDGGAGDDVIYGDLPAESTGTDTATGPTYELRSRLIEAPVASISITEKKCEAGKSCYGGDGSQELIGSSGNDRIFGQRGNDILYGNSGNDELFGGVGDESLISGGAGNDLLSGGLGTDVLNGNQESDLVRGDGTIDTIEDTGPSGTDTLSFATAVTPGFHGAVGPSGFPADLDGEERGVDVHLDGTTCAGEYEACDNEARYGGGYDNVEAGAFENVIGSPFADVIVGSSAANRIDGGGGADAIYGGNGEDALYGGADGDFLTGGEGTDTVDGQAGADNCVAETTLDCSGSSEAVVQRERTKIAVGFQVASPPANLGWVQLYLTGSTGTDRVKASYTLEAGTGYVTFVTEGESAPFDTSANAASPNCAYEAAKVKCTLPKPLDAITLAGMAGNDSLQLEGFPEMVTPVLLGGEGNDELATGNGTEDMLVDGNGSGADSLRSGNYDDALIANEGADSLQGGNGNDLLLSASLCDGDSLDGATPSENDGTAVNSASWAKLPEGMPGVIADLEKGKAGNTWSGSTPACSSGTAATLAHIDDLEGSSGADQLYGDAADNNLLGRLGKDEIWGREGADRIEAQDEIAEVGGGGPGTDSCTLDASDKFNSCNP